MSVREAVLEEAEIIRRDGGEIPEVTLWNCLHYLTEDPEGPRLRLTPEEMRLLKQAVIERYLFIIKRDLTYANMDKSFYRGLTRALINWQRLKGFVLREGFSLEAIRLKVLEYLRDFLQEFALTSEPPPFDMEDLKSFLEELAFPSGVFLRAWYLPLLS